MMVFLKINETKKNYLCLTFYSQLYPGGIGPWELTV